MSEHKENATIGERIEEKKAEVKKKIETKKENVEKVQYASVAERMGEIEKEYGGFGSIPLNHNEYWELANELRKKLNDDSKAT